MSARRVGVLVPAGNTVHEREFAALQADSVEFAFRGFVYPSRESSEFCVALADSLSEPMAELRAWGAELVLLGCTTASMLCARCADVDRFALEAALPVVTAAAASLDALDALGLRALSVATPYGVAGNAVVREFLESEGITVTAIEGLALDRSPEIWKARAASLPPEELVALGSMLDSARSEGLYLPCTGVGSLETINAFERATGKPALSSVQAGYWACLRKLGIDGRRAGFGRLIERWNF